MNCKWGRTIGWCGLLLLMGCRGLLPDEVVGGATAAVPLSEPTPAPKLTLLPVTAVATETAYPPPAYTVELYPGPQEEAPTSLPVYSYRLINTYPHDPQAFTQGLVYEAGDILYEGTGLKGESSLRRVQLGTGEVEQSVPLAAEHFGEGIAVFNDKIYQLTWQSQVGFVYDKASLTLLTQFSYPTEGWGITHDGQQLIMSDGTATLYFWDPNTLAETGRVQVVDDQGPVVQLNELEYVNGEVWANIWKTDRLARIDPATGQVVGWIDLTGLLSEADRQQRVDVLNGIAYDAANGRLFVTGKWWPKLFEIELVKP